VDCRNATTAEWLQLAVPSFSKWSGVSMEVKMGDDLPSSRNITIFCPRTGDKTTKDHGIDQKTKLRKKKLASYIKEE